MSIESRLTRLETLFAELDPISKLSDEELNQRLPAAINGVHGSWQGFLDAAARIKRAPVWEPGSDLSALSDAELAAIVVSHLQH